MISCQSVIVEYRFYIPDVDFPTFPELEREVHKDGSWTIPKDSVDSLAEYYIRIQETEKDYKDIQKMVERGNEK